ncbi:calcium-translocating P-type ATPase [Colletotrichum asianum]
MDAIFNSLWFFNNRQKHLGPIIYVQVVREQTDQDTHGQRNRTETDRNAPLLTSQSFNLESIASDENDQQLPANHDQVDGDEEWVLGDVFKDIQLVVQAAVTVLR